MLDVEIAPNYHIEYLSERSVPDELVDETDQNIWIVIISYILMFIYVSLAIGKFPSSVNSGFLLGLFGLLLVIISIICSIGVISYFGVGLTLISLEVIPFLILAIGVDNMFILVNSLYAVPKSFDLHTRVGLALKSVGPSITTATLCEACAFLVGSMTNMPALQSFCF